MKVNIMTKKNKKKNKLKLTGADKLKSNIEKRSELTCGRLDDLCRQVQSFLS